MDQKDESFKINDIRYTEKSSKELDALGSQYNQVFENLVDLSNDFHPTDQSHLAISYNPKFQEFFENQMEQQANLMQINQNLKQEQEENIEVLSIHSENDQKHIEPTNERNNDLETQHIDQTNENKDVVDQNNLDLQQLHKMDDFIVSNNQSINKGFDPSSRRDSAEILRGLREYNPEMYLDSQHESTKHFLNKNQTEEDQGDYSPSQIQKSKYFNTSQKQTTEFQQLTIQQSSDILPLEIKQQLDQQSNINLVEDTESQSKLDTQRKNFDSVNNILQDNSDLKQEKQQAYMGQIQNSNDEIEPEPEPHQSTSHQARSENSKNNENKEEEKQFTTSSDDGSKDSKQEKKSINDKSAQEKGPSSLESLSELGSSDDENSKQAKKRESKKTENNDDDQALDSIESIDDDDLIEEENKYVIMPDSKFKNGWNILIIFYMLYTATVLPYRVCFVEDYSEFYYYFDFVMNVVFGLDILVSFFSAYYDEDNVLVTNNRYIAIQYLQGWFLIDFISVFPFGEVMGGGEDETVTSDGELQGTQVDSQNTGQYGSLVRLARLPRLYRLIRLFRLVKMTKTNKKQQQGTIARLISSLLKMNASIKRMIKTMGLAALAVHLAACFYFLIAKLDAFDRGKSWVHSIEMENSDPSEQYLVAIHWSIQTLTTVGLGDVGAQSDWEKVFAIVWMGIAGAFFSFMISNLQGAAEDSNDNSLNLKFNRLLVLQSELQLPEKLTIQIKRQLDFAHKELKHHQQVQNSNFIEQLPSTLKAHVLLCVYTNVLNKVPFFVGKDIELIMNYIPHLNAVYLSKNDVVYQEGDHPEEVYFVYQGEVSILDQQENLIKSYTDEQVFGVMEIMANINRVGSAVASECSYLFSMSQDNFMSMVIEFAEIHEEVYKIYYETRKSYYKFMTEDERINSNVDINEQIDEYKEKYAMRGNIELSLKKYNIDTDQYYHFHANHIRKNNPLCSIHTDPNRFDDDKFLYFDLDDDVDKFLKDLANHYDKDMSQYIDEIVVETETLKKTIKMKMEYYMKKQVKLQEVKNNLIQIKQNLIASNLSLKTPTKK